jgi:hypothetical protein
MTALVLAACVDGVPETAQVNHEWAKQFYGTFSAMGEATHVVVYSADVVRARNRIAQHVIDSLTAATHVLWWDTDMFVDDHVSLIREMIELGVDVVGAPYARKRKPRTEVGIPILPGVRWQGARVQSPMGEATEMSAVGFGFTLTSVDSLRRVGNITDSYMDRQESGDIIRTENLFGLAYRHLSDGSICDEPCGHNVELLSEDYSFCLRWRSTGGRIWLYRPNRNLAPVSHVGDHAY